MTTQKDQRPICRFCKSPSKNQTIRAGKVYGGLSEHKFWRCEICDLVYLWPIPTIEEENKFYRVEFEQFMEGRSGNERDWSGPEAHIRTNQDQVKRRLEFLKDYIHKDLEILEIGCSSGFMLDAFRENEMKPIGIEPSGVFSNYLKKKGYTFYPNVESLRRVEPEKRFDLIVHFFVLEHIRDTVTFIKEQLDLLKSGGSIIAEVPCVNDPLTSLYDIPAFDDFYWSVAHHYYFSPKAISNILNTIDCKYEIIPTQRYDLSNHLVWMQQGKPGGQGVYNIFSDETLNSYKDDLIENWVCDTFILYIQCVS